MFFFGKIKKTPNPIKEITTTCQHQIVSFVVQTNTSKKRNITNPCSLQEVPDASSCSRLFKQTRERWSHRL